MAITGFAGRLVSQHLPTWQAWLRSQAAHYSAMRAQSPSPVAQFWFWLLEWGMPITRRCISRLNGRLRFTSNFGFVNSALVATVRVTTGDFCYSHIYSRHLPSGI
jgi:hypothetical protein